MSHSLTRRNVSAIAKLDLTGQSHSQRIDAIARAIGYETGAALMGSLKSAETSSTDAGPFHLVAAFGSEMSRAISENLPLIDNAGDSIGGDLKHMTFATKAEYLAYLQGAEDAEGWMDYDFALCQVDQPNHPFLKALADNPELSFEDWYAADLAAQAAEEAAHLDSED
jgi:hypothetical protein